MNTALPAGKINPLNQVLITHVLNEARHGNYHHCRALGFTDEMLLRLQKLTPNALTLLTHTQAIWIKPQVDANLFERLMSHIDKEEARDRLVQRALLLGASNPMMEHFFALTHSQCAHHRRLVGANQLCKGRPPELSDEQRHSVWKRWMVLLKQTQKTGSDKAYHPGSRKQPANTYGGHLDEMTQLDLMMLIAEEQALSLASIWNELNPYLHGEPPERPGVRSGQKKPGLAEKTVSVQALNRRHSPRKAGQTASVALP